MNARRLGVGLALMLAACKGGLHTAAGNDFPCDFSQPEAVRDDVCAAGEVCGVDNICRQYRYEGPQFDNGAQAPQFSRSELKHPRVLTQPVVAVGRATIGNGRNSLTHLVAVTSDADAGLVRLSLALPTRLVASLPYPGNVDDLTALALPAVDNADTSFVVALVRDAGTDVVVVFGPDGGRQTPVSSGDRLRAGKDRVAVVRLETDGGPPPPGALLLSAAPFGFAPLDLPDAGRTLEVRLLSRLNASEGDMLVVTRDALYLRAAASGGGTITRLTAPEVVMPEVLTDGGLPRVNLRHNPTGTIAAFTVAPYGAAEVLSSWRLDRGATPSAMRLWNDCAPCQRGRIAAFVPVTELGNPSVEVLCANPRVGNDEKNGTWLSLVRVTGSSAASERQSCAVEPLEAPFPLDQVYLASRGRYAAEGLPVIPTFDEGAGRDVLLGGKRGQLWSGHRFSSATPLFLERTPLAFGTWPFADGGLMPVAITDRYIAAPLVPDLGYQALKLRTGELGDSVVASALVQGAPGWLVLSNGDTVLFELKDAGEDEDESQGNVSFGPRLVNSRGEPARSPFFGEASVGTDGGVLAFVMTADDSLYLAPPPRTTTGGPNTLPPLTPQLTPAPSSPIRSFALDRSALGTSGTERVRGYVVAGRQLFLVTLNGAPARWTATALVLQGGEPVEVWMDHPRGGLGRAGFRDGQVFTLPGGFLLVNALPLEAGSRPPQVLDYENLGGWPVAMTNNGLFEAHYDVLEGGALDNRRPDGGINKPMNWRRVTLPDGGEPWLNVSSRLQVTQETVAYDPATGALNPLRDGGSVATARLFRLLVYTGDQVLEVGSLLRR